MGLIACFVSSSHQNVFFTELQDALAEELGQQGIAIQRAVDHFPPPREGMAYVCVPHELLPRLLPEQCPGPDQLRRTVMICTEQPGTHWFEETAQAAARASCAIDINRLGVDALRSRDVDARLLQLGYTPRWDSWRRDFDAPRRTEVTLLAGATPRRLAAVARCGRHLAGRRTELHLPEALVAYQASSKQFISGEHKWALLADSKLLLNIHRGELGYFEWQRAVEAIVNGCVLLSEHSLGFEPLVPGEHFVSCSFDSLDVALEGLLDDEARLQRIRTSAYELLREHHPLSASIDVLSEAVGEAARAPLVERLGARALGPAQPKAPQLPPPAWELIAARHEASSPRPTGEHETGPPPRAEPLPERLGLGDPRPGAQAEVRERFGTRTATPRVSALLSFAGGETSVAAPIEGLALSDYASLELVVVDRTGDRETGRALRLALAAAPWVSGELITLSPPVGDGPARNRAVELATGELLLLIESATAVYPHSVTRLVEMLDREPTAAFAYGPVEVHGAEQAEGLDGYLGWEPYRLRYGSFVGGLALLRRTALLDAGGFTTDPPLEGWEDFALWCALADRGQAGVRVPEILARRRRPLLSPSSRADADPAAAWRLVRERFSCLTGPLTP